jgi:ABC-type amino acid transport system permease subunit
MVMAIGVTDLVFEAQQIEGSTFHAFEAYTTVLIIFVVVCTVESALLAGIMRILVRKSKQRAGYFLRANATER